MTVLTMERLFPSAPEKVFAFLTKTEHLLKWWGPEGVTIAEHTLDFTEPGSWWAIMVSPQGHPHKVGGEIKVVEPPNYVELTLGHYGPDGTYGDVSTLSFRVTAEGAGSKFTLTQTGLNPDYIADIRDKGWASALLRLERLIVKTH
jgi:uncharacterized protein YndB with AHSA1/START domain